MRAPAAIALVAALAATASAQVVINEIMYHPASDIDGEEFIELHSVGAADLSGWSLANGIDFVFPPGSTIGAGGYLVIASDPATVEAKHGIAGVLGPWSRRLSNAGETVELRDGGAALHDTVTYADGGLWPSAPDGGGPSLELINPALDNALAMSWAASVSPEGTPGRVNSVFAADPVPPATDISNFPVAPRSDQTAAVRGHVADTASLASVTLHWRHDTAPTFNATPMLDDGFHADGVAGDGIFGALVAPQPVSTTVEFYVETRSLGGGVARTPSSAPTDNMLWQVDDRDHAAMAGLPLFRVVMTQRDWDTLVSRDVFDNTLLNATFVSGTQAWHRVGIRYRGSTSRLLPAPLRSHRIEFFDPLFNGVAELNLNAQFPSQQVIGLDLFARLGLPAPLAQPVAVVIRDAPATLRAQVESLDDTFLPRHYGLANDHGNLYRGDNAANLDHRGADFDFYRGHYIKETNVAQDDYSDIVALCDAFTNLSDAEFAQRIGDFIDVDQWLLFFAANLVMSNREGGITVANGDDYFLYRNPATGLFEIIPWDMDSVMFDPYYSIFRPELPAIQRLLHHPAFAWRYHQMIRDLVAGPFSIPTMNARIDALVEGYDVPLHLQVMRDFMPLRHENMAPQTPTVLAARLDDPATVIAALPAGADWWGLAGTQDPAPPLPELPDLPWHHPNFRFLVPGFGADTTPLGHGYAGVATDVSAMQGVNTTHFLRRSFDVPAPQAVTGMRLSIRYDDGFVAHLNGVEVTRRNAPGFPGSAVPHTAVATTAHPASTAPEVIDLSAHIGLLVAGSNTLGVMGLSADLDDATFLLDPALEIDALPSGQFFTEPRTAVTVAGIAPVIETREVRVNGALANLEVHTGQWSHGMSLAPGVNEITVTAHGPSGDLVAVAPLSLIAAPQPVEVSGTLTQSATWRAEDGPRRVTGDLTVPAGVLLTIEPGAVVGLDPGVGIQVAGGLSAGGDPERPVIFTSAVPGTHWGRLDFQTPDSPITLDGCVIDWGTVLALEASLEMRHSALRFANNLRGPILDWALRCIGSAVTLENCVLADNEAHTLLQAPPSLVLRDNIVTRIRGDHDGIDIDLFSPETGATTTPTGNYVIENNFITDVGDDGIDWFGMDIAVRGNFIRDTLDKGISADMGAVGRLENNVIVDCTNGVVFKIDSVATITHCTVAGGARGLIARNSSALSVTDSIVWGQSDQPLVTNATGSIEVAWSDVQGGVPSGAGNISADPLFLNPARGNLELRPGSPCLGAASLGEDMGALPRRTWGRGSLSLH